MPRILSADPYELELVDHISGDTLLIKYRMPTTAERTAYGNACVRRKRNKIEQRVPEARREYGQRILVGIRDGDWVVPDGQGGQVPISSDQDSPHYREDWRELIAQFASDVLEALAARVFDGSVSPAATDDEDEPEAEDAEGNLPATSN